MILNALEKEEKAIPRISNTQFGDCLLSFLRLQNIFNIDILNLQHFLEMAFEEDEKLRNLFWNIDLSSVIFETASELFIVSGAQYILESNCNGIRILFSRQTAEEFIQLRDPVHRDVIMNLASKYIQYINEKPRRLERRINK